MSTARVPAVPAPSTAPERLSSAERAMDELVAAVHVAAPHDVPELLAGHGRALGVTDAIAYLVDLQQTVLLPLLGPGGAALGQLVESLPVDSTLAGRAFQHGEVLTQDLHDGRTRVWLPLVNGAERLGVLAVTTDDADALTADAGALGVRLRRMASAAAEVVVTKTLSGDTLVTLRRNAKMGVAAEIQWSLLPPLTFASSDVTIAAALEPAYEVAGDSVDYAVEPGCAHVAVFDGMGHGLQAALLAVLAVGGYRNARRSGQTLRDTVRAIDATVTAGFHGEAFATALVAQLDTDDGTFTWISAGHPAPLLLRDGRLVKVLEAEPALPLGLSSADPRAGAPAIGVEALQPGDRVLLYTDGVVEARAQDGGFFGLERLVGLVTRSLADGLPAPETMRRVVHALLAHQESQLSDDATLLLLQWRGHEAGAPLP